MDIEQLLSTLVEADRVYRAAIKEAQAQGGGLIKEARKALGLTQRQLAERLRLDPTYISKIENGRMVPSKNVLRHIAQLMAGEEIEDRAALRVAATGHPHHTQG